MISVIVPVYNCGKYLIDSINSLINQTIFDQLEIIFVNDGSTDDSEIILRSYVDSYSNIKVYTQSNNGVSVARNVGIENCNGDYICFFDADDVAKPELYEKLLKTVKTYDADMAIVDYSMVFPDGVKRRHRKSVTKVLSGKDAIMKEFFAGSLICTNPVDKIFRTDMIRDITFPKGYAIGEDMFFIYQVLRRVNKVAIDSTESLYLYCLRSDSAMKNLFSDKHIDSVRLSKQILKQLNTSDYSYKYAEANYIHEICKMLDLYMRSHSPKEYNDVINSYKKELKDYNIRKALLCMNKKHFIAFLLMRFFPKIYLWLYRTLRIG